MMALCLGERIRAARKNAGMTQRQLAEKVGVSNTSISNWEKGISNPDPDTIQNLCWALCVQPNYFFYDELPQIAPEDLVRVVGGWMTSKAAALAAGLSENELSLIYAYRKASLADKQIIDNIVDRYSPQEKAQDLSDEKPAPSGYSSREELENEADLFAAMAREQFLSEKLRESEASSANASGAG